MAEEWGPWIEHDGKGCPCVGRTVEAVCLMNRLGERKREQFVATGGKSWTWAIHREPVNVWARVIRYRIRRPDALLSLIDLAENTEHLSPETVTALVGV